jgi:L-asparaginase
VSRVAVVFTGGTISMTVDPVRGGNVPTLGGVDILARTPGLEAVADVVPIDRGRTPASHFGFEDLFAIGNVLRDALADPATDGAVVVQGTDTIEETAFLWDLVLDTSKPVVVTGAMRSASESPYDGPANLRDAVRVAASPSLRGEGVLVVLAGTIEPADSVLKSHASSLETFRSPDAGPVGRVVRDAVVIQRRRGPRRHVATTEAATRVHLVTAHVAMDGSLVDAAMSSGADGFVVAATGSGNTSATLLEACERVMAAGVPVVLASRCPAGAVHDGYAFPGGGATWARAGAILAGHLSAPKARIALALGLGAGMDHDALGKLLADPVVA